MGAATIERARSCLRELMSSLVNALRRWYSTVRELMNSSADLRVRLSLRGEPRDLRLLGGYAAATPTCSPG